MPQCPCDSTKDYSQCCEPYLLGLKNPATPTDLMRSRYTAYTLANIDYIQKTMMKKAAENYNPLAAKQWALSVKWLGLTVIDSSLQSDSKGTVTFLAKFSENNKKNYIYEKSLFEKINGQWFYVNGIVSPLTDLTLGKNP